MKTATIVALSMLTFFCGGCSVLFLFAFIVSIGESGEGFGLLLMPLLGFAVAVWSLKTKRALEDDREE